MRQECASIFSLQYIPLSKELEYNIFQLPMHWDLASVVNMKITIHFILLRLGVIQKSRHANGGGSQKRNYVFLRGETSRFIETPEGAGVSIKRDVTKQF